MTSACRRTAFVVKWHFLQERISIQTHCEVRRIEGRERLSKPLYWPFGRPGEARHLLLPFVVCYIQSRRPFLTVPAYETIPDRFSRSRRLHVHRGYRTNRA